MINEDREIYLEHRKGKSGIRVRGAFIPFMRKGQQIDAIICVPKGWNPLEERGVIVPGSQTGQCATCGQDIWIAPSTQELMKEYPNVPTRCIDCVTKQVKERGITLVEVLIVLAILAILAAIVVPNLLRLLGG